MQRVLNYERTPSSSRDFFSHLVFNIWPSSLAVAEGHDNFLREEVTGINTGTDHGSDLGDQTNSPHVVKWKASIGNSQNPGCKVVISVVTYVVDFFSENENARCKGF